MLATSGEEAPHRLQIEGRWGERTDGLVRASEGTAVAVFVLLLVVFELTHCQADHAWGKIDNRVFLVAEELRFFAASEAEATGHGGRNESCFAGPCVAVVESVAFVQQVVDLDAKEGRVLLGRQV